LQFHHHYNANAIMNAKGAQRWMHHMKASILKNQPQLEKKDPRILPCLVDFLKTKMENYAKLHAWEFDESDFKLRDFYPTMANSSSTPDAEERSTTTTVDSLDTIGEEE
jgi:hypothetical protein